MVFTSHGSHEKETGQINTSETHKYFGFLIGKQKGKVDAIKCAVMEWTSARKTPQTISTINIKLSLHETFKTQ